MTDQEIVEGNRIISEWIGWSYVVSKGDLCDELCVRFNSEVRYYDFAATLDRILLNLEYNSSWNKLMLIVEKIEALPLHPVHGKFGVYISSNNCSIQGTYFRPDTSSNVYFSDFFGYTKIEAVYLACISFIKWHNENIKSK